MLTKYQKEAARLIFGDKQLEAIVQEGEEMTRKLESLGIGFKSVNDWLSLVDADDTGYDYDTWSMTLSRVARDELTGIKYKLDSWRPSSLAEIYFGPPGAGEKLKANNPYFDGALQTAALEQQELAELEKGWNLRRAIDAAFKGE
jgi:hypothetical protein